MMAAHSQKPKQTRTRLAQARFLETFATCRTHTEACKVSRVSRPTVAKWIKDDEAFKKRYDEALDNFADSLFKTGLALVRDGWSEPIMHNGEVVGSRPKKSERLIELYLKAHLPEFRDKHEITGAGGAPLKVTWLP